VEVAAPDVCVPAVIRVSCRPARSTCVAIVGDLGAPDVGFLEHQIADVATSSHGDIELDLGDVTFLGLRPLLALVSAAARLAREGRQLRIEVASRATLRSVEVASRVGIDAGSLFTARGAATPDPTIGVS
jgi:hypothetical protein